MTTQTDLDDEIPFDDQPEPQDGAVWISQDGQRYTMERITNTHLRNIIKHLRRQLANASSTGEQVLGSIGGTNTDGFTRDDLEKRIEKKRTQLASFVQEAKRRNAIANGEDPSVFLSQPPSGPTGQKIHTVRTITISDDLLKAVEEELRDAEGGWEAGVTTPTALERLAQLLLDRLKVESSARARPQGRSMF